MMRLPCACLVHSITKVTVEPGCSAPHSLLAMGKVDPLHPDLVVDPLGILRPHNKLTHQLPLVICPLIRDWSQYIACTKFLSGDFREIKMLVTFG